ncbi:MAG: ArdC-like ssDNA-binding domain-containing protein [Planctomycetota bacterium]
MAKQTQRSKRPRRDVYQEVTDTILAALDAGTIPWRNPVISSGPPANLISEKPYRGVNIFLLQIAGMSRGYASPWWLTFKQAQAAGGSVRKGEKGTQIVFWRILEKEQTNDVGELEKVELPLLRFYSVFNSEQCDGIEAPDDGRAHVDFKPIDRCEQIDKYYRHELDGPSLGFGSRQPLYRKDEDTVMMPDADAFESAEEFYSTLFHEHIHSTGHPKRLARWDAGERWNFRSKPYGKEELIAECGSAFLCAEAGISPRVIENQTAYIAGWQRTIRADKKLVILAAAAAQKANDHILGTTFDQQRDEPGE